MSAVPRGLDDADLLASSPPSASATSCSTTPTTRSSRSSTGSSSAAHDPDVLAIKMTLYRVGRNAPAVEALLEAAAQRQGGRRRSSSSRRASTRRATSAGRERSKQEGVHVVYGLVGLKTHSKIAMVVRREGDGIRRYVHLGTGNYNVVTARAVHRPRPVHLRPGDRRGRHRALQLPHRLLALARLQEAARRAAQPARPLRGPARARDRAPEGRPRRAPHLQDELADRPQDDRHPLPGLAGGREDRPAGARHVLAAARACPASATTSA